MVIGERPATRRLSTGRGQSSTMALRRFIATVRRFTLLEMLHKCRIDGA
jgi:hypothetical protein